MNAEFDKLDSIVKRLVVNLQKQNRNIPLLVAGKLDELVKQGASYGELFQLYSLGDVNTSDVNYLLKEIKTRPLQMVIEEFAQKKGVDLQKQPERNLKETVEDTTLLAREISAQIKVTQNLIATVKETYEERKEKEVLDLEAELKAKDSKIENLQKTIKELTEKNQLLEAKSKEKSIEKFVFVPKEEEERKKIFPFFWKNKIKQKELEDFISIITEPNMTDEVAQELKTAYMDGLVMADIKKLAVETGIEKLRKNRLFITGLRGLTATETIPATVMIEEDGKEPPETKVVEIELEESKGETVEEDDGANTKGDMETLEEKLQKEGVSFHRNQPEKAFFDDSDDEELGGVI
ncbi:hypothetical protein M2150_001695 [Lachnospiraceae bacterium PM6-15]|uniref:hypothetical protein n=1 Tax=Ohessyouella blattaphilus TaxID=2949333 RepID=UPI003E2C8F2D